MNATHSARSNTSGVTTGKDVQPPQAPPAQRRPMTSVSAPGLYPGFSAGSLDQAQSSNLVQAQKQPHRAPPHQQGQAVSRQPQNPPQSLSSNHPQNIRTTERSEPGSLSQQCDRQPQNLPSDSASSTDSSTTADHDPPVGFFTARAAESVQSVSGRFVKAPAFDPHLESPSIRKTAGVDHTKTKPVERELIRPAPIPAPPSQSNFRNPQADKTRRIGMPVGAASPLQNRGSYKPPQMKRPAEGNLVQ